MEGVKTNFDISKKAWMFLAFSFVAHLAFLFANAPSIDFGKALEEEKQRIVVKLVAQSSKERKQIVQTQKSKEELSKPKKTYLGKENNSTARETKASEVGTFKQAGQGVRTGHEKLARQIEKTLKNKKVKNLKFSDLAFKSAPKKFAPKKKKRAQNSAAKGLENGAKNKTGLSRSNDFIEEVPLGDFTKLNTQEYEFYGFYHRIRQKLEQFWGHNVQEQMEKIYKSGRSIASGQNLLTGLVIQMNQQGEIVNIRLNSTSGIKELDDVAINSFNQAGPFPNPPKGLVKNGVATIKWGFAVEAN
ncbi:MAG: TonB C-terminal domain-containing protein [Bacteriovoracaceae bacterium]